MNHTGAVLFALAVAALGACSTNKAEEFPPPTVVPAAPAKYHFPAECTSRTPAWVDWQRDVDTTTADVLRKDDANHAAFDELGQRHVICGAAVKKASR